MLGHRSGLYTGLSQYVEGSNALAGAAAWRRAAAGSGTPAPAGRTAAARVGGGGGGGGTKQRGSALPRPGGGGGREVDAAAALGRPPPRAAARPLQQFMESKEPERSRAGVPRRNAGRRRSLAPPAGREQEEEEEEEKGVRCPERRASPVRPPPSVRSRCVPRRRRMPPSALLALELRGSRDRYSQSCAPALRSLIPVLRLGTDCWGLFFFAHTVLSRAGGGRCGMPGSASPPPPHPWLCAPRLSLSAPLLLLLLLFLRVSARLWTRWRRGYFMNGPRPRRRGGARLLQSPPSCQRRGQS